MIHQNENPGLNKLYKDLVRKSSPIEPTPPSIFEQVDRNFYDNLNELSAVRIELEQFLIRLVGIYPNEEKEVDCLPSIDGHLNQFIGKNDRLKKEINKIGVILNHLKKAA